MTKEDDFGTWAILGAAGAAVVGLLISAIGQMGPPKFPSTSQPTANSYQSSSYNSPPPPKGGCGCSAGK